MPTLDHKRGDSFRPRCTYTVNGVASPTTGMTIASHIRTASGSLVCALEVYDRNDAGGQYSLRPTGTNSAETNWPIDSLLWDIQYTDTSTLVRSTETITLNVLRDETR